VGTDVDVDTGTSLGTGVIVADEMIPGTDVHPLNKNARRTYTRTNLAVFFISLFFPV
jgi:hypothetical protein